MAQLLDLPPELHLQIFEAVTSLSDLNNLLQSSDQLRNLFSRHFDGQMRTIIIPRICPGNTAAVEDALQAACSDQGLKYHYWAEEPELGGEWEFPAHRDVWDRASGRCWDPVDVLQHLKGISADVKAFLRMVKDGKGHTYWTANRLGDAALEDALWDVQAHTLRVANIRAIELRGDCSHSRKTTHNALWSASEEWFHSLTFGKCNPLYRLFRIAQSVDQHLRRHLLAPTSGGILFRMVYGMDDARLRLENLNALPPGRSVSAAISFVDSLAPVALKQSDDTAYEKFSRDIRLKPKAKDPASVHRLQSVDTEASGRTARVLTNLAAYLENMRPVMQTISTGTVDIVAQIGAHRRETARMLYGGTLLEKHLGTVVRGNRYGEQPLDVDDVLPDMTNCLNTAVARWGEVRNMERRSGIRRRFVLPAGLSFSGVAENEEG